MDNNDCLNATTVSEIIAASEDGELLIYTDSATENIGFVDISDPTQPQPAGLINVGGEPTSVAVAGAYALAVVNTRADFVNPSGQLKIIHIPSRTVERSIELGGQPDSIAVSPDRRYAAMWMARAVKLSFSTWGVFLTDADCGLNLFSCRMPHAAIKHAVACDR